MIDSLRSSLMENFDFLGKFGVIEIVKFGLSTVNCFLGGGDLLLIVIESGSKESRERELTEFRLTLFLPFLRMLFRLLDELLPETEYTVDSELFLSCSWILANFFNFLEFMLLLVVDFLKVIFLLLFVVTLILSCSIFSRSLRLAGR